MKLTKMTLTAAIALLLPCALKAQSLPHLLFTEQSSTVLTATLDGSPIGTVQNTSPDHWNWDSGISILNHTFDIEFPGKFLWNEPEGGSTSFNVIGIALLSTEAGLSFTSDEIMDPHPASYANGDGGTVLNIIIDGTSVFEAQVFVNDLGDATTNVPDSGSTLGMMSLSAMTLFGFVRLRKALA